MTRCLAHGCQKADTCPDHLAIRQSKTMPDGNVVYNLCAVKPYQSSDELVDQPWQSLSEGDVRRAAWEGK